jgi:hypothetical protein
MLRSLPTYIPTVAEVESTLCGREMPHPSWTRPSPPPLANDDDEPPEPALRALPGERRALADATLEELREHAAFLGCLLVPVTMPAPRLPAMVPEPVAFDVDDEPPCSCLTWPEHLDGLCRRPAATRAA